MDVDDALHASVRVLAERPADLLPLYFLGAAAVAVGRVSVYAGGAAAYLLLAGGGHVAALRRELDGVVVHPGADPAEAVEGVTPAEAAALVENHVATPGVVAVLSVAALAGVALALAARAVANAGELHAVRACLAGERGTVESGAAGLRRDGPTLLAVAVARVLALGAVLLAVGATAAAARSVAVEFAVALSSLGALAAVYVGFSFAPQAVVVDRTGVVSGVRESLRFAVADPARYAVYVFVVLAVLGVTLVGAVAAALAGVQEVVVLVFWFVALPFLDLYKTGLYMDPPGVGGRAVAAGLVETPVADGGDGTARDEPEGGDHPPPRESTVGPAGADEVPTGVRTDRGRPAQDRGLRNAAARLSAAVRTGLARLRAFAVETWTLSVASLALVAAGGVAGWRVVAPFGFVVVREQPVAAVFGPFPVGTAVSIAANNWLVAVTQSVGGLAAGVPTVASLLFNGFVVGAVSAVGFDPVEVLALVAPHGVVEFPALAVSGALGLHLGAVGVRFARGRADDAALAAALRRAFDVLVGLLVVFAAAAVVEAFVTPWVASLVA